MTNAMTVPGKAVRGLETASAQDVVFPEILLMQGLSKGVQEGGKKPGEFMHSLTGATLTAPLEFVPVVYFKYFDVLKDDGTGKQMVFDYRTTNPEDPRVVAGRFFNSGDEKANVVSVHAFIVLVNGKAMKLTFKKTSYRVGAKLISLANDKGGDLFSHRYTLTAVKETGKKGSYYLKDVTLGGDSTKEERAMAEGFYSSWAGRTAGLARPEPMESDE